MPMSIIKPKSKEIGDGDLMEGVASEAASLAGHLKLGKLTCLYDDNHVTLAAGMLVMKLQSKIAYRLMRTQAIS